MRNALSAVDRDRESDASSGAGRSVDGGIDADDFTARINERTAGISAIDGSVGLNRFIDEGGLAGLHGAADGADYSGGQRALKAKRIANGENFLADLQRGGITELQGYQVLAFRFDLHQRDVVALIGADKFCRVARLIPEDDFDGLRFLHHVEIRKDVA